MKEISVFGFEGLRESSKDFKKKSSSIAQSVEHSAVNRSVAGSSPAWGVKTGNRFRTGSVVKRLRHRPFTAVTRVRFSSESLD